MPKIFSDNEKEYIKKRLKEEVNNCLNTYGYKKTTVDELVQRVNIPKGTFYLFYKSKELLIYDLIDDLHEEFHEAFIQEMIKFTTDTSVDSVTNLIFKYYKLVEDTFLYKFIISNDLELLMRKLPDEIVRENITKDEMSIERMLSTFPGIHMEDKDIKVFGGAFRALFLSMQYRREIGEEVFDQSLKYSIRGLVLQMMCEGGKYND